MCVFRVLIDRLADIRRYRSRRAPTWASNAGMVRTSLRSEPFTSDGFPEGWVWTSFFCKYIPSHVFLNMRGYLVCIACLYSVSIIPMRHESTNTRHRLLVEYHPRPLPKCLWPLLPGNMRYSIADIERRGSVMVVSGRHILR